MGIKGLQEKIEAIRYHDARTNDFQINCFGDEIVVYFDNYDEYGAEDGRGWKVSFLICNKVSYETDASWVWNKGHVTAHTRGDFVKNMTQGQLCFYGQHIILSEADDFIIVEMDLICLNVNFQCKEIEIEKIDNSEMNFFWKNNVLVPPSRSKFPKVNVKKLQKKINKICFDEKRVSVFQINYFGDEVDVYLDNEDGTWWKVSFLICDNVSYETNRKNHHVRNMTKDQLSYCCQGIILSEVGDFTSVKMDLTIMTVNLQCKLIEISSVKTIKAKK